MQSHGSIVGPTESYKQVQVDWTGFIVSLVPQLTKRGAAEPEVLRPLLKVSDDVEHLETAALQGKAAFLALKQCLSSLKHHRTIAWATGMVPPQIPQIPRAMKRNLRGSDERSRIGWQC